MGTMTNTTGIIMTKTKNGRVTVTMAIGIITGITMTMAYGTTMIITGANLTEDATEDGVADTTDGTEEIMDGAEEVKQAKEVAVAEAKAEKDGKVAEMAKKTETNLMSKTVLGALVTRMTKKTMTRRMTGTKEVTIKQANGTTMTNTDGIITIDGRATIGTIIIKDGTRITDGITIMDGTPMIIMVGAGAVVTAIAVTIGTTKVMVEKVLGAKEDTVETAVEMDGENQAESPAAKDTNLASGTRITTMIGAITGTATGIRTIGTAIGTATTTGTQITGIITGIRMTITGITTIGKTMIGITIGTRITGKATMDGTTMIIPAVGAAKFIRLHLTDTYLIIFLLFSSFSRM